MATFHDIIGQEQIKEHLQNAISAKKISHAYIINGEKSSGKEFIARVFAMTLQCEKGGTEPCQECHSCKQALSDNQPDIIYVSHEKPNTISVDDIRAQINNDIAIKPYSSPYKIYIMNEAEKMTPQAQNALLKSLEEPVAQVVFLLMTHELTATLGTIASRCVRVKLSPWPDEQLKAALLQAGYPMDRVEAVLPRSAGNIGQALDLLRDGGDGGAQEFVTAALSVSTDAEAVGLSTRLKEGREGADAYLAALEEAIYQALLVRTGRMDAEALKAYPALWRTAAERAPVSELNALLTAVMNAKRLKAGQVNWQSNIDHLMMRLLEEHTKWRQSLA